MKNLSAKAWILIFAALFIVCCGAFVLLRLGGNAGTTADIYIDGELYKKIDLSAVSVAYDIEINTEYGYNKIHVVNNSISVCDADCDDRVCIKQGSISDDGVPIICMPHRLVIEIEGDGIDG